MSAASLDAIASPHPHGVGTAHRSLVGSVLSPRAAAQIVWGVAAAPFVFPGTRALNVAAKVAVFILLVASYDLLLGYTGIVSFAHTMFFGIGGYGVGIASAKLGASGSRRWRPCNVISEPVPSWPASPNSGSTV